MTMKKFEKKFNYQFIVKYFSDRRKTRLRRIDNNFWKITNK